MYQRYYKQRKFGRVFSVFLIIGSGLSHYVKEGKGFIKAFFSMDTYNKYEEYIPIPNSAKELIQELKEKENNIKDISEKYLNEPGIEEKIKFFNDCDKYNKNLDLFKKEFSNDYLFSAFAFEEKDKEIDMEKFKEKESFFDDKEYVNENYNHKTENNSNNKYIKKKSIIEFSEEDIVNIYLYDKFRKYEKKILNDKI
jgi:hypothetical protein